MSTVVKYVASGRYVVNPARVKAADEMVALRRQIGGNPSVEVVVEIETGGDRRLERRPVDVGEELFGGACRGDERRRTTHPSRLSTRSC